jgi:4-amino-4-deoxy-L-arabinose transferase-like glycosyltransferase
VLKKIKPSTWILIFVLILGAFFRLYRIGDYMEFLGDQSRDVLIVRDFLQHGNVFFIGPQTSIGNMYLGPWFYYLIAPSLLLANFNPIGPAIFITIINIFTIYLVYFVGKKWFNLPSGLMAAFLFAISPVAIRYSNFIWNPNVMACFSLLFVYFFFESFRVKKYQNFIYASLSFVMVMNSHYLGLALLPFIGVYWLFYLVTFIKRKSAQLKPFLKYSLIAATIFFLSLIPQTLFDIKHDGQNIKSLLAFFTQRETTVNIKLYKALPEIPSMFNQINTSLLAGKNETVGIVVSVVFALLIILSLIKYKKQKKSFWYVFFWYLSGIIALALYKQHIYDHYFTFLFPVVFLFIGYLIIKNKLFGIPLLIIIFIFSVSNNAFKWPPNYQLKTTQEISNSIISSANGKDFNFALLSKMGWGFNYYLYDQKNYYEINQKLTDQLFVICVPFQIDCNPINNPEYNVAAFGWAKIDSEWEINGIKIFRLLHTQGD